jgi:hypothetical protein
MESECCLTYGICGRSYWPDVVVGDIGYVTTSRLGFKYLNFDDYNSKVVAMQKLKELAAKVSKDIDPDDLQIQSNFVSSEIEIVFPYSYD